MSEVNNFYVENVSHGEKNILANLLEKNGNCLMTGYLGADNVKFTMNDRGMLEFETIVDDSENVTKSQGAVLRDGVVIKQVQKSDSATYNQLFAWNIDDNSYTYIVFDDYQSLVACYEKVKEFDVNLAKEDISSKFAEMGISFANVAHVLLNQKVDSVASLVEEANKKTTEDTSFIL